MEHNIYTIATRMRNKINTKKFDIINEAFLREGLSPTYQNFFCLQQRLGHPNSQYTKYIAFINFYLKNKYGNI